MLFIVLLWYRVVDSGEKWGIFMLMGEYRHNIDDKNRLIIPSKFRDEMKEEFVITKGLENCLFIYPMEEWKKMVSKLESLPFTKKDARNFVRFFMSGAEETRFDKQGRIQLASSMVTYANILKECVVIGVGNRLEIWSSENWDQFLTIHSSQLSDLAENLFDANLDF